MSTKRDKSKRPDAKSGQEEIKRLRHKFVLVTSLLMVTVLVISLSTITVISRQRLVEEANTALATATMEKNPLGDISSSAGGGIWLNMNWNQAPTSGVEGSSSNDQPDSSGGESDDSKPQSSFEDITGVIMEGRSVALTICQVDSGGSVTILYNELDMGATEATAAIKDMELPSSSTRGTIISGNTEDGEYMYMARASTDGWRVAMESTDFVNSNTLSIARILLFIGMATMAILFLIVLALSHWIVRPIDRAWRQQQQFIADASHELKTPLAVITANNSIIEAHPSESVESQMQWVQSTQEEAALMSELVEDMLFLAKSSSARAGQEEPEEIDLSDIVESASLQFESIAYENGITIESEIAEGISIQGIPSRVKRVVSVLLDNACKYAGEDGTVKVSLERMGIFARLSVNNTGEVIPPQDIPHVFDRFYRADKARVREKGGFGLGLAIAKEIVEDHGGAISVASDETRGTTFTVELKA